MRNMTRLLLIFAILIQAASLENAAAGPSSHHAEKPPRDESAPPRNGATGPVQRQAPQTPAPLGPAPRLEPIGRFVPPIDPWVQSGLAWGVPAINADGEPLCLTNQRSRTTCDSAGP